MKRTSSLIPESRIPGSCEQAAANRSATGWEDGVRIGRRDQTRIDFGLVEIRFMGEITAGRVIFGPDDVEPILGVTALESVGITIDPANRALKRLPAIPLKRVA